MNGSYAPLMRGLCQIDWPSFFYAKEKAAGRRFPAALLWEGDYSLFIFRLIVARFPITKPNEKALMIA